MEKENNHCVDILLVTIIKRKIKKRVFKKRGYKITTKEFRISTLLTDCYPISFGESKVPSLDGDNIAYDISFSYN